MLIKMRNTKGFTLVELMIVVAIIGILAALAIPAFMRTIKKSKAAEAEGMIKKMSDGAKAYFSSEQRYSVPAAMGGDQPWHAAGTARNDLPGMPVPWASYAFPGGAGYAGFSTGISGGVGPVACADAPQGGTKQIPFAGRGSGVSMQPAAQTIHSATMNKLGVNFEDGMYFIYGYVTDAGVSAAAVARGTAMADFVVGAAALCHTLNQEIRVNADTQEPFVVPAVISNELE